MEGAQRVHRWCAWRVCTEGCGGDMGVHPKSARRVHTECAEGAWRVWCMMCGGCRQRVHRGCVEGAQRVVVGTCSQLKTS